MLCETLDLSSVFPKLPRGEKTPTLTAYVHRGGSTVEDRKKFPAMLILPGGGYHVVSDREGEPIAMAYYAKGFNCFVLDYTVVPDGYYPTQLVQAAASATIIRTNTEWNNTDYLAVCGFSAGGHLAASLGTRWMKCGISEVTGQPDRLARPDAMVLCYAAPTVNEGRVVQAAMRGLNGKDAPEESVNSQDLACDVTEDTPPAFFWHTAEDETVPIANPLRFAAKMQKAGVPTEVHIFPFGPHGMALADPITSASSLPSDGYVARWVELSIRFLALMQERREQK